MPGVPFEQVEGMGQHGRQRLDAVAHALRAARQVDDETRAHHTRDAHHTQPGGLRALARRSAAHRVARAFARGPLVEMRFELTVVLRDALQGTLLRASDQ